MLKLLYRLRRRNGIVLFAVIAIMTLLIAMASTAYLTARSSYKTVVSNYDYSQLYLSTSSISDMMLEALTQDTSHPLNGSTYINYYQNLKKKVQDMRDSGSAGSSKITLYSDNLSGINSKDSKNISDLMEAAGDNPIEPGVLDGLKVQITFDKGPVASGNTRTYYFTITTTGFYRGNSVEVSDIVYNKVSVSSAGSTPSFDTFFTSTSQAIDTSTGDPMHEGNRVVKIDTDSISDNAYFQTDLTSFIPVGGSGRNNYFEGGLRTSGTLFIGYHVRTNGVPAPNGDERHDWIIGGDMILSPLNDNPLIDLNGNNVYVAGDLIINYDGNDKFKAQDIYVCGNVYVINGGVTGNVHCAGTVYQGDSKTLSTEYPDAYDKLTNLESKLGVTFPQKYVWPEGMVNIDGWKTSNNNSISASNFDPENVTVKYSTKKEDGDTYSYTSKDMTISALLDKTGNLSNLEYGSYSANTNTNEVTIDVGNTAGYTVSKEDDEGNPLQYMLDCGSGVKVYIDGSVSSPTKTYIDIPYTANGYTLNIKDDWRLNPTSGNGTQYIIHTSDSGETMPIVLNPNFYDGNGDNKNSDGFNAFSWAGASYATGTSSQTLQVLLVDEAETNGDFSTIGDASGNVVFELGNYTKGGGGVQYDPTNASSIFTATYYVHNQEFVGTKQQYDAMGGSYAGAESNMLQSGSSKPKSGLDPRIMLVSNKNGGTAIDGNRDNNLFCGYFYAPNSKYVGGAQAQNPVFGGMIVSEYELGKTGMVYAEPNPQIIKDLLDKMKPVGGGTPGTPTVSGPGTWFTRLDTGYSFGQNYLG